jgi:hypothetical protein
MDIAGLHGSILGTVTQLLSSLLGSLGNVGI